MASSIPLTLGGGQAMLQVPKFNLAQTANP